MLLYSVQLVYLVRQENRPADFNFFLLGNSYEAAIKAGRRESEDAAASAEGTGGPCVAVMLGRNIPRNSVLSAYPFVPTTS